MKLLDQLSLSVLLRQFIRATQRVETQLTEHNRLLTRLADRFAPTLDQTPVDPASHSVDYTEDRHLGRVLDYIDQTRRDVGREPTEEEVIRFLEDREA